MPGRDVLFNLKVNADPSAMKDLKAWADACKKAQEGIDKAAEEGAKKLTKTKLTEAEKAAKELEKIYNKAEKGSYKNDQAARKKNIDDEIKESQKRDKVIAGNYLKEHLRAIDERVKAEKRQESELADWKKRLRANSAKLEQQENIRLAREAAGARIKAQDEISRQYSRERRENRNNRTNAAGGFATAAGGFGSMARGVAYSGLIGEKSSESIVNTLLGVEAAKSVSTGGMQFAKGASAATGMAMGAGGAMAGGGAAMAALVAWLPALASAVKGAAVVIKGSSITRKGDISGGMGEGIAGTYSWALGGMKEPEGQSQFFTDPRGGKETLMNPYIQAGRSQAGVDRMTADQQARRGLMANQVSAISNLGDFQRNATVGNISASQSMLGEDVSMFKSLATNGKHGADVAAAYENVRQSMEQVKRLSIDSARAQIEGSRDQLNNLRGAAQEAQRIAEQSKSAYESDISKASKLDPEGESRLREIDRKRKAGEGLSRSELEFAEGFNEFKDYTKSEQERRAEENGLSDIFAGGKESARKNEQAAISKQIEVWQSEVEVEMKHEVIVKLEGASFLDQLREQFGESAAAVFSDFEEKIKRDLKDTVKGAQTQAAIARSPTR